jgi:hypothetical protein
MKMKYRITSIMAFGFAIAAWGQQGTPPTAQPADSGPTLAATMQFIQEKLSEQGKVGWVEIVSSQPGWTYRHLLNVSDVMADSAACTLYATETNDFTIELPKGQTLKPGGSATVDDLHKLMVDTDTIPFKKTEKITVEKLQDVENKAFAEAAHPEYIVTLTPPVFYVKLWASNNVFSGHVSTTTGKHASVEQDVTVKTIGLTIRDEETANKIAKAMTHAMELCGGGPKKEIF